VADRLPLPDALGLGAGKSLVAITGAGGKTTLMFALAGALPGRTVMTTTTRLAAAQLGLAPAHYILEPEVSTLGAAAEAWPGWQALRAMLAEFDRCLVVARLLGDKAIGVAQNLPQAWLALPEVDHVLVEADGARLLPCKAPAGHEPVVPAGAGVVIVMAGLDAVGGRIGDVAHRPERVAALVGRSVSDRLEALDLARLLTHPEGGLKGVPPGAQLIVFLNKAETTRTLTFGRQAAATILREPRVERVVAGALTGERPVREVHQRITAVVLAAGVSERMGSNKLLLPWGAGTVLGKTLDNLRSSSVHDICAVTGHEAEKVAAIAAGKGAWTVHNQRFEAGMLSSLQAALRVLPDDREAVLVVLADQPMVGVDTIERLLAAQRATLAGLVAPTYAGKRGNPVLIARRYFSELLALPPGSAPRDLLQRHAGQLLLVPADNDAVLHDLDRPEEYERWRPPGTG
jgi:molybdenum cofactor cytidylyltransferase